MNESPDIPRELLERYSTSAPRYTSYPTAVDWSGDFDAASYPQLLEKAAQSSEPISLYLHIPFCAQRCLFCGCNVVITSREDRVERYIDHLLLEIEEVAKSGIGQRKVRQYHWGGGTPTHLSLAQIERVQDAIDTHFTLTDDAEAAIEVDPSVTKVDQIELLAKRGFNRLSMGVQDFDEKVQADIRRIQTEEETRAIVDASRALGMSSLNIDLIYGLPHQTQASFRRTVERIIDIRPERIALFHYAHVPWIKKHQTAMDINALPSSEEKLSIFINSTRMFHAAGYVSIGLDHFALPEDEMAIALSKGNLQRNFMGYTTRRGSDMISLGVSSIGDVAGAFVQNEANEPQYLQDVAARGLAATRGHILSADDRLRRDVILSLMCNSVLNKRTIEAEHGIVFDQVFARELQELAPLEADGLLTCETDALRLTPLGRMFMRNVALVFDTYFRARQEAGKTGTGTFSKTL